MGVFWGQAPFSYLRGVGDRRLHSNGFALPLPDGKRLLMMGHVHTDTYTEPFKYGNTYLNHFVLVESTPPFKFLEQSPPFCFPAADNRYALSLPPPAPPMLQRADALVLVRMALLVRRDGLPALARNILWFNMGFDLGFDLGVAVGVVVGVVVEKHLRAARKPARPPRSALLNPSKV